MDISTIAFKLASMLAENTAVQGGNFIGKSQNDIERLFERMKNSRDDGRSDSRGRGRGNFSRIELKVLETAAKKRRWI